MNPIRTVLVRLLAAIPALALAALLSGPALAGSGIEAADPWARPTIPNRPGAVYLELRNHADAADRLVGVRAEGVGKAELHRAEEKDGMMTMAPVEAIEVPPGAAVRLEPGGFHIMLFDIAEPLEPGDTVRLVLEFERAGEVRVAAPVAQRMGHGAGHGTQHGATGN